MADAYVVESMTAGYSGVASGVNISIPSAPLVDDLLVVYFSCTNTIGAGVNEYWIDPLGSSPTPGDASTQCFMRLHVITEEEALAGTVSFNMAGIWQGSEIGRYWTILVRNVDVSNMVAGVGSWFTAGDSDTNHRLAGIYEPGLSGGALLIRCISTDGANRIYGTPSGHTKLQDGGSVSGGWVGYRNDLTTENTVIPEEPVTPNNGDEGVSISIALNSISESGGEIKSTSASMIVVLTNDQSVYKRGSSGSIFDLDLNSSENQQKQGSVFSDFGFAINSSEIQRKVGTSSSNFGLELNSSETQRKHVSSDSDFGFNLTSSKSISKHVMTGLNLNTILGLSSSVMKKIKNETSLDLSLRLRFGTNAIEPEIHTTDISMAFQMVMTALESKSITSDSSVLLAIGLLPDVNKTSKTESLIYLDTDLSMAANKHVAAQVSMDIVLSYISYVAKTAGLSAAMDLALTIAAARWTPKELPPPERTLYICEEDRILVVSMEDRIIRIPYEDRIIQIV